MRLNSNTKNKRFTGIAVALLFAFGSQVSYSQETVKPLPAPVKTTTGPNAEYLFTSITKEDLQLILADLSPEQRKELAENPDLRKSQVENLRELLAIGSAAVKSGIIDSGVAAELENIRLETVANAYDREINKSKTEPPFGWITPAQIKAFYAQPGNLTLFEKFLSSKMDTAKKSGSLPIDSVITGAEKQAAKDLFAKYSISDADAKLKAKQLGPVYARTVALKTHLQQTQFLAGLYTNKVIVGQTQVSDGEVAAYISAHPELTRPMEEKARAILARAKAGENFAKLADENSEDPGSTSETGARNGGLYKDVPPGKMLAPFEKAALALEPGQISSDIVVSDIGYHIIKLERKGATYDVRHILISTMIGDPANPAARPQPVIAMVRGKLEEAKTKQVIDEIVRNNPVSITEDFSVPTGNLRIF